MGGLHSNSDDVLHWPVTFSIRQVSLTSFCNTGVSQPVGMMSGFKRILLTSPSGSRVQSDVYHPSPTPNPVVSHTSMELVPQRKVVVVRMKPQILTPNSQPGFTGHTPLLGNTNLMQQSVKSGDLNTNLSTCPSMNNRKGTVVGREVLQEQDSSGVIREMHYQKMMEAVGGRLQAISHRQAEHSQEKMSANIQGHYIKENPPIVNEKQISQNSQELSQQSEKRSVISETSPVTQILVVHKKQAVQLSPRYTNLVNTLPKEVPLGKNLLMKKVITRETERQRNICYVITGRMKPASNSSYIVAPGKVPSAVTVMENQEKAKFNFVASSGTNPQVIRPSCTRAAPQPTLKFCDVLAPVKGTNTVIIKKYRESNFEFVSSGTSASVDINPTIMQPSCEPSHFSVSVKNPNPVVTLPSAKGDQHEENSSRMIRIRRQNVGPSRFDVESHELGSPEMAKNNNAYQQLQERVVPAQKIQVSQNLHNLTVDSNTGGLNGTSEVPKETSLDFEKNKKDFGNSTVETSKKDLGNSTVETSGCNLTQTPKTNSVQTSASREKSDEPYDSSSELKRKSSRQLRVKLQASEKIPLQMEKPEEVVDSELKSKSSRQLRVKLQALEKIPLQMEKLEEVVDSELKSKSSRQLRVKLLASEKIPLQMEKPEEVVDSKLKSKSSRQLRVKLQALGKIPLQMEKPEEVVDSELKSKSSQQLRVKLQVSEKIPLQMEKPEEVVDSELKSKSSRQLRVKLQALGKIPLQMEKPEEVVDSELKSKSSQQLRVKLLASEKIPLQMEKPEEVVDSATEASQEREHEPDRNLQAVNASSEISCENRVREHGSSALVAKSPDLKPVSQELKTQMKCSQVENEPKDNNSNVLLAQDDHITSTTDTGGDTIPGDNNDCVIISKSSSVNECYDCDNGLLNVKESDKDVDAACHVCTAVVSKEKHLPGHLIFGPLQCLDCTERILSCDTMLSAARYKCKNNAKRKHNFSHWCSDVVEYVLYYLKKELIIKNYCKFNRNIPISEFDLCNELEEYVDKLACLRNCSPWSFALERCEAHILSQRKNLRGVRNLEKFSQIHENVEEKESVVMEEQRLTHVSEEVTNEIGNPTHRRMRPRHVNGWQLPGDRRYLQFNVGEPGTVYPEGCPECSRVICPSKFIINVENFSMKYICDHCLLPMFFHV